LPPGSRPRRLPTLDLSAITPLIIHSKDLLMLKNDLVQEMRSKKTYSEQDLELIEESFSLMINFHREKTHPESGERIAIHLLQTARTLAMWGANAVIVSAGLLHLIPLDKINDSKISEDVLNAVRRKKVLGNYLFAKLEGEITAHESRYLSKMCLIQEGGKNIWLLEAADEFTTLSVLSPTGNCASRSYHVTANILRWFSLNKIALVLEDIALLRLDKIEYERIEGIIEDANKRDRKAALDRLRLITELIGDELTKVGINFRVQIDVKSVASAKKKMERGDELTDASRFRFIIDGQKKQCKQAMIIIQSAMEQLDHSEIINGRANYIDGISIGAGFDKGRKPNGYESIHLHYAGEKYEPINVQIRTEEMHEWAEMGGAAHGRFKLLGIIKDGAVDQASQAQKRYLEQNRKYVIHNGTIYRLIPDPAKKNKKVNVLDLAFAVSPDHGLRCPDQVTIERASPLSGERTFLQLPFSAPLKNGDIVHFEKGKIIRRKPSQVATIFASTILELVLRHKNSLDPNALKERISFIAEKGKMAIDAKLLPWQASLRTHLLRILARENIKEGDIDSIYVLNSNERAAKYASLSGGSKQLYLTLGVNRDPIQVEQTVDNFMQEVSKSSLALAYRAGENEANLWMLVVDVPGILPSIIRDLVKTFGKNGFNINSLEAEPVTSRNFRNYSLVKINLRTKRKEIRSDLEEFSLSAVDIYKITRHKPAGRTTQIKIGFTLNRISPRLLLRFSEYLLRNGANINQSNIITKKGKKVAFAFTVSVPEKSAELYGKKLRGNLEKLKREVKWLRMDGREVEIETIN